MGLLVKLGSRVAFVSLLLDRATVHIVEFLYLLTINVNQVFFGGVKVCFDYASCHV